MLRFKQGNRGAFESLFARYRQPLMSFLARMLHDHGRAEELAQEVFVRVYRARERYEPRARFSTWLFGIASHLALNELARSRHKKERPLEGSELEDRISPSVNLDEQIDARDLALRIQQAITQLPDRQRAALLLRAEQGLGYEEISRALKTSASSVKSLLHRARESLLSNLKELGP